MATSQKTSDLGGNQHKNLTPVLICLALAVLTIIAFWQIKDCGFINFDDDIYIYENAHLQSFLNWKSIGHAFSFYFSNWHPLTWLSWMLDYSIFGLNPFGYHLVNLLLHILNTVLLFLILWRMTKTTWPSALVAVLFAIHPLHVESVAWISERKDVLSTFFLMLTLGAYSYYVEYREWKRYVLVILFFTFGLMSKSMLVTLPFVLMLLDYWPLARFSETKPSLQIPTVEIKQEVSGKKKKSRKKIAVKAAVEKSSEVRKLAVPEFKWSMIYPLIMEKIPLFTLAVLSSIVTYVAQQKGGAVRSVEALSPVDRIGNAFVSYIAYIFKMILPVNLAVFYPLAGFVSWQAIGAMLLVIAITAVVIWKFRQFPYLVTGWFWYVGTLVPVIGIIQVGAQARADRYTYIPLIGLFIIVAWGAPDLLKKWNYRKEILVAVSALVILCLSIITWIQVGYWQNSIALYDQTLRVTENNGLIHNNRGFAHYILGDYNQAVADYSAAIAIKPDYATAYHNRGIAYSTLGDHKQAILDFNHAIELKPDYSEAYNNRGKSYSALNDFHKALEDINRAITIKPEDATYYHNRGYVHFVLGNPKQAIDDFDMAVRIKPDYADAYNSRGAVFYSTGNYRQAVEDCGKAIGFKPDFAGAYNNRGLAYAGLGDKDQAVNDLKTAAKLGDERAKNVLKRQGIVW
ncbi:MAG: hypothetical protein CVU52_10655 [Deltaproteobacteria bacterium HGW-Deltaproteobacteria-10]|jgi:tetratricopeptide (TPR) repeat protein|nr:MAG: hypothetical protein CVU52_10655 [Deltaproteobacteria bacterium HGW-Deltaproteobacteria-10]